MPAGYFSQDLQPIQVCNSIVTTELAQCKCLLLFQRDFKEEIKPKKKTFGKYSP